MKYFEFLFVALIVRIGLCVYFFLENYVAKKSTYLLLCNSVKSDTSLRLNIPENTSYIVTALRKSHLT
jgi:hypothetical protein